MTYDPLGPMLHLPDRQWDTDDEGLDPDEDEEPDDDEDNEDETPEDSE